MPPVGERGLRVLAVGSGLVIEVAVGVDPAHEHGRLANSRRLRPGRQHLDEQEEAPVGPEVSRRPVDERVVEHRHLARTQREVDSGRLVERLGDVLAAGEDALGIVGLLVAKDPPPVRAGNAAQTPLLTTALGEREGTEDDRDGRAVERILVPPREGLAVGLLHPPRHAPAAEVRPDQVLEDVEDVGILGDVEHPRTQKMGFRLHLLDVGHARLQRLEPRTVVAGALGAHRAHRRQEPVSLERLHLGVGQDLRHGVTPPCPSKRAQSFEKSSSSLPSYA